MALQESTLFIPSMSCNHCVQTITKALQTLPGIQTFRIDLAGKAVHLTYSTESLPRAEIEKQLTQAGYPPRDENFLARGKALPLY